MRLFLQIFRLISLVSSTGQKQSLVSACSSTETVEGSSLSLESVDNVESSDGLSLGVLGVDNGVSDDVLEERSENGSGLLVDVR